MVDFDREFFDKRFRPDSMTFGADELCGHHFGGPETTPQKPLSNLRLRSQDRPVSVSEAATALFCYWFGKSPYHPASQPPDQIGAGQLVNAFRPVPAIGG
jgi:hypothetical protein